MVLWNHFVLKLGLRKNSFLTENHKRNWYYRPLLEDRKMMLVCPSSECRHSHEKKNYGTVRKENIEQTKSKRDKN